MTVRTFHDVQPDLPTRERAPGKIEVQCPTCEQWRPSFCIVEIDGDWKCDADVTREARSG